MSEVQGERLRAEQELGDVNEANEQLTLDQARALIAGVRDAIAVLHSAAPMTKAQLYQELGLEILYQPNHRQAVVTAHVVQSVSEGRVRHQVHATRGTRGSTCRRHPSHRT